jgi:hypothetical protein
VVPSQNAPRIDSDRLCGRRKLSWEIDPNDANLSTVWDGEAASCRLGFPEKRGRTPLLRSLNNSRYPGLTPKAIVSPGITKNGNYFKMHSHWVRYPEACFGFDGGGTTAVSSVESNGPDSAGPSKCLGACPRGSLRARSIVTIGQECSTWNMCCFRQ